MDVKIVSRLNGLKGKKERKKNPPCNDLMWVAVRGRIYQKMGEQHYLCKCLRPGRWGRNQIKGGWGQHAIMLLLPNVSIPMTFVLKAISLFDLRNAVQLQMCGLSKAQKSH